MVITSITTTMPSVRSVSGTLRIIMLTSTLTIVIALLNTCGILWLTICLIVSVSFVYTDMISPWACVSKYLIGSVSIWENRSFRRFLRTPCVTLIINLLYVYAAATPTA